MPKTVSVRVSSTLFDAACHTGTAMTRSGAQQLEHWAKLGQALERQGLAPDAALRMLAGTDVEVSTGDGMWSDKRAGQRGDRAAAAKDPRAARKMLLFPVAMAQTAKVLNGTY